MELTEEESEVPSETSHSNAADHSIGAGDAVDSNIDDILDTQPSGVVVVAEVENRTEITMDEKEEEISDADTKHSVKEEDTAGTLLSDASENEADMDATEEFSHDFSPNDGGLLSLPLDSLHHIASFLTPREWSLWGETCTTANRVSKEVIRRVALHGFKCAVEVISAWKSGHHADAKELAALYIKSGVPIYPQCLGHSYRTIIWRMRVEMKAQQIQSSTNGPLPTPDPFYIERLNFRASEGYCPELSYTEEKALFWMERKLTRGNTATPSSRRNSDFRRALEQHDDLVSIVEEEESDEIWKGDQKVKSDEQDRMPPISISIHRHLLDQHEQGFYCVDDEDENMTTLNLSLSSDFFHPRRTSTGRRSSRTSSSPSPRTSETQVDGRINLSNTSQFPANQNMPFNNNNLNNNLEEIDAGEEDDADLLDPNGGDETPPRLPPPAAQLRAVLNSTKLEVYCADSSEATSSDESSTNSQSHTQFTIYERRLAAFLARSDYRGFDECMMDFWDDFFPQTVFMHYFDQHTAVPRPSCLEKFLTRPCPKAVGVVQCEIERIKITSKGKGVKGRFFPTYEYRLFIRHHPPEGQDDDETFVRNDLLLLVAKHQGRNKQSSSESGGKALKKGANNYCLYLPQSPDIEAHFKKVNNASVVASHTFEQRSNESIFMGRLQGNFIGTEFQLFVPRNSESRKMKFPPAASSSMRVSSDDEGYDSGMSSDNNSSRRSRFGRFLRSSSIDSGSSNPRRSRSAPQSSSQSERRPNRRAIANENQPPPPSTGVIIEEEDGVITYTANLLGSRPRIMDVCIPKVSVDGVVGEEWKQHLETSGDSEEELQQSMLHCFKQLQQRLEALDPQQPRQQGELQIEEPPEPADENEINDDHGLLALQNRPPWWNVELGSFVLNFGGRVSVASVKNFQLCDRNNQDDIMLQFGRIQGRHSFTMDFQYPLTAVQAFSIAISSLQSKISFG